MISSRRRMVEYIYVVNTLITIATYIFLLGKIKDSLPLLKQFFFNPTDALPPAGAVLTQID
jgi:hypothetical protein